LQKTCRICVSGGRSQICGYHEGDDRAAGSLGTSEDQSRKQETKTHAREDAFKKEEIVVAWFFRKSTVFNNEVLLGS